MTKTIVVIPGDGIGPEIMRATLRVMDDGAYALGRAGDLPVTGDWTHSGYSALGTYRPSIGAFTLKYNLDGTPADLSVSFDGDRIFRNGFEMPANDEYPLAGYWGQPPE